MKFVFSIVFFFVSFLNFVPILDLYASFFKTKVFILNHSYFLLVLLFFFGIAIYKRERVKSNIAIKQDQAYQNLMFPTGQINAHHFYTSFERKTLQSKDNKMFESNAKKTTKY